MITFISFNKKQMNVTASTNCVPSLEASLSSVERVGG